MRHLVYIEWQRSCGNMLISQLSLVCIHISGSRTTAGDTTDMFSSTEFMWIKSLTFIQTHRALRLIPWSFFTFGLTSHSRVCSLKQDELVASNPQQSDASRCAHLWPTHRSCWCSARRRTRFRCETSSSRTCPRRSPRCTEPGACRWCWSCCTWCRRTAFWRPGPGRTASPPCASPRTSSWWWAPTRPGARRGSSRWEPAGLSAAGPSPSPRRNGGPGTPDSIPVGHRIHAPVPVKSSWSTCLHPPLITACVWILQRAWSICGSSRWLSVGCPHPPPPAPNARKCARPTVVYAQTSLSASRTERTESP